MATRRVSSEIIEKERKKILEILKQDPDFILDTLASRKLISEDEYETLEKIPDPLKKTRKLLIVVQRKGEGSCQHFLKCLFSAFPESATTWNLKREFLKHENVEPCQYMSVRKNSKDVFFPLKKNPENLEITVPFNEKEYVNSEMSEYSTDNKTHYRETAWLSRENEKEYNSAEITLPHSVANIEYKAPSFIEYLQDGQRYEEPDDSLYLGKEEYLKSLGYSEDLEAIIEGENYDDPENIIYEEQEDVAYSENYGSSDEGQNYKESENKSLEEEEVEKTTEERKKIFQDVLSFLEMDRKRKFFPDIVKQFSREQGSKWTPKTPGDLVWNFLMKIQALDVTARDPIFRYKILDEDREAELRNEVENSEIKDLQTIDPLDILCASLLCSDSSLQCEIMCKMYQCKFALPLLLPDAENNKSIFMLGAMKSIIKEQSTPSSKDSISNSEKLLALTKMPIISFMRLGYCSCSKSRILNTLLNPATKLKPPKVFLHRDLTTPVLPRKISDGLVEVAWYFPERYPLKENPSFFQNPVALANLHGDLETLGTQFSFLMDISSAVFFFTECLGEKEWNLLMFLHDNIERCYFVLSPQARESEEVQIFQRILKLKASQLLFWEEEAEEAGKNMEGFRASFEEVMSSSLRCMSLEDMALLARELGIQVDQDFDNVQMIQDLSNKNLTKTAEIEGQPRSSSLKNSPERPDETVGEEAEVRCEVIQNIRTFHPIFNPHLDNASPLTAVTRGNLNKVSWKAPWVTGSHFWSEQRTKWFCPSPFKNKRDHTQGESFGTKYCQPQRFYSHERFMKFLRTAWVHHTNGILGKSPRSASQHVQVQPERVELNETLWRHGERASQIGHFHSQSIVTVGKPQPKQAGTQGTQLIKGTGKLLKTSSFNSYPHLQAFQAGAIHNPMRHASWKEERLKTQSGTSNPAFHVRSHPMSSSEFIPSFQLKSSHLKSSQVKHPQSNPSQPLSLHLKAFQTKLTQPQSSQSKLSQPQSSQSVSSQPQSSQTKPSQPHFSQPVSSHPQSSQSLSSQTKSSQSRSCQPQSSQSKTSHLQSSQSMSSQIKSSQSKSSQTQSSQSKSSQPQSSQALFSQTKFSQNKPSQPQFSHSVSSQTKSSQSRSSQPQSSQSKTSHLQSSQSMSSQIKSFQSNSSQTQSSQSKSSHLLSSQSKSFQSQTSQSKFSQPQSSQSISSQTKSSQFKSSQPQSSQFKPFQSQSSQSKFFQFQSSLCKPIKPPSSLSTPSQPQTFQSKTSQLQSFPSKFSQLQLFSFKIFQPHPSQYKSSQPQHFQSKSSQPQSSHSKITQFPFLQSKPSQACSSQYKPQLYSSQSKASQHYSSPCQSSSFHSFQSKPTQHQSYQYKSSQFYSSQSKASQHYSSPCQSSSFHSSQSKPTQHHSYRYKSSQFYSSQSKPSQSYFSHKTSQHKSTQPKSSWTSPSQAKANYSRTGTKRIGKH